jgi:ubiquinone/menaquinone biosynthesis C-methylase UbiE
VVIPWVFEDQELAGDVLEIGSGYGANAAAILERFRAVHLTATDVDPAMAEAASKRLAGRATRSTVQVADASRLPFEDAVFDVTVSMLMLHHVGDQPAALAEMRRVLRPGGSLVGYDLTASRPVARLHRGGRSDHVARTPGELHDLLVDAGFGSIIVEPALGGLVVRFSAVAPGRR